MNKNTKNIIEAGITPDELEEILSGVNLDTYLTDFPSQSVRYYHLCKLALLRESYELAEYFDTKSGIMITDWCD